MAHFAELNENNIVIRVIVVGNDDCKDVDGKESETVGVEFCKNLARIAHYFPNKIPENPDFDGGVWKQTSYNGNIRKNYAGFGFKYQEDMDAFIPPKPFPSWSLNLDTARWDPPVPYPTDNKYHTWDEDTLSWISYDITINT